MPQKNSIGQIALKRLRQSPKLVTIPGNKQYYFAVQYNISLAWVDPEDVNKVLAVKHSCCGGNPQPQFVYASERDVRMWTGAAER